MANTISCPHCGKPIEINQALKSQISQDIRQQAEVDIRRELTEKVRLETEDLRRALAQKEKKVEELISQELQLRSEKRRLEEKEKELNLAVDRRVDDIRKKTEAEVIQKTTDEFRLKNLEKDKKIQDLMTALEDAQRKAKQGSQQLQGEILELDLEETLRTAFPDDQIEPVSKGVRGADVRQLVKSSRGYACGTILWESKRTKSWTDEWIIKLKDDLRAEAANIPIIVSTVLPKEIKNGLGIKDGVWIIEMGLVLPMATLLRKNLIDVAYQKFIQKNQTDKASQLYEYITGHEFRQQLEAMVEVYREMQMQIDRERTAFEKIWKAREGQIRRLLVSTAQIGGGIQGSIGSAMPPIKGLELLESANQDSSNNPLD